MAYKSKYYQQGQSLIEITIALAVSFLFLSSAVVLIGVALRTSNQNTFFQAATFLSQDLVDRLTVAAENKWYCPAGCSANFGVYNLQKTPTLYHLTTNVPFQWALNKESVVVNGVTYSRYFFLENVSRDDNGDIEAAYDSNNEDPSTQKATIVTEWQNIGSISEVKLVKYLTRANSAVFAQTDWSAGPTTPSDPPLLTPGRDFFSATNINWNGNIGQLRLP